MSENDTREVRIGQQVVKLERLSSFKVVRGSKALSRITKLVSGLDEQIQKFVSSYREANTEVITRAQLMYRQAAEEAALVNRRRAELEADEQPEEEIERALERYRHELSAHRLEIPDEVWKSEDNKLELHRDPTPMQIGAVVLPHVIDSAEGEVLRLLALIVTPDEELRAAKRAGNLDEVLAQKADELLFDAEIEDLLELAAVATEVLSEKLRGKALRLRAAWQKLTGASSEEPAKAETSETSGKSSNSTSSTDSPPPTDGQPTSPSSPSGTPQPVSSGA